MRKDQFLVVLYTLLTLVTVSCSGSVTGPSTFDSNKQIDSTNRPPSPPAGIPASLAKITMHGIFKGDCSANNGSSCGDQMSSSEVPNVQPSDEAYWVASQRQVYTLKVCFEHSGWGPDGRGRSVGFSMSAGPIGSNANMSFYEGDGTQPSQICRAIPFSLALSDTLGTNSALGRVHLEENGYDLFDYKPVNSTTILLGFRVIGTS